MTMANGRGCATAISDHLMTTGQLSGMAQDEVDAVVGRWGFHGRLSPDPRRPARSLVNTPVSV